MLCDFDEINAILAGLVDDDMVEPIDDPSLEINYWDWAEVVGIVDDVCPEEPFWANSF